MATTASVISSSRIFMTDVLNGGLYKAIYPIQLYSFTCSPAPCYIILNFYTVKLLIIGQILCIMHERNIIYQCTTPELLILHSRGGSISFRSLSGSTGMLLYIVSMRAHVMITSHRPLSR